MKKISTKPKVPKVNIQMPKKPTFGIKTPRIAGLKNPFRLNR